MTTYGHTQDQYLETEVFAAGPVRRVQMLYEAAVESVTKAKNAQASGDIATRAKNVNKATAILTELAVSLDRGQGGNLAAELIELYDYSIRRLLEGSVAKQVQPFAEVEGLLRTLLDAWRQVPEVQSATVPQSEDLVSVGRAPASLSEDLVAAGFDHLG